MGRIMGDGQHALLGGDRRDRQALPRRGFAHQAAVQDSRQHVGHRLLRALQPQAKGRITGPQGSVEFPPTTSWATTS
ncbi:MAG: hypothetical protein L0G49_13445 [Luteococcus sp.]|nr:hypothetical protein [Luteococcus sp.]MDN5564747.1 hypothetical protein [Luteococcus sp.]